MSAEQRQIVEKARDGAPFALASLVRIEGSSYRREGARLLLATDGTYAGTISGGCLEGDLVRRAKWLIRKGPVVQHYSTAFDDTAEIPFGLGCGGELDLLLEPAFSLEFHALLRGFERTLAGFGQHVVTWLPQAGTRGQEVVADRRIRRAIFQVNHGVVGRLEFASEDLGVEELALAAALEPGAGWPEVFVERLAPPQRLVIYGAGDDARPIVALGRMLGWNIEVADGRRQLARLERFRGAERVSVLEPGSAMAVGPLDAVVLMTHSYEQDRELLTATLKAGPRYVGLLGARHRSSLLVAEVADRLGWSIAEVCARIYAPVGLDLGGDGAEAIALAIVSEIQACVQGRPGLSRRLASGEVMGQVEQGGSAQYLEVQCALREA